MRERRYVQLPRRHGVRVRLSAGLAGREVHGGAEPVHGRGHSLPAELRLFPRCERHPGLCVRLQQARLAAALRWVVRAEREWKLEWRLANEIYGCYEEGTVRVASRSNGVWLTKFRCFKQCH